MANLGGAMACKGGANAPRPDMTRFERDDLAEQLWPHGDSPDGTQVHAVVDAARDPRIFPMIVGTGLEHCCLFAGSLTPDLHRTAPHLVHLAAASDFTREFLRLGWGQSWGIMAIAPPDVTLQQLRRHFRSLLRVRHESGRFLLFRFYDPRVLHGYLPTCTPAELKRLFGPVRAFVYDTPDGGAPIRHEFPGASGVLRRAAGPLPSSLGETASDSPQPLVLNSAELPNRADSDVLRLRNVQRQTLARWMVQQFEQRMVRHIGRYFPRQCRFIGQASVNAAVLLGIERAQMRGYHTARQICMYLSLAFLLGSFFDEDPQYPWASHADAALDAQEPTARISRIFASTMIYLDAVHGERNTQLIRALVRVRAMADARHEQLLFVNDEASAQLFLSACCPTKAARQPHATADLWSRAVALSGRHGWRKDADRGILLVHAFLLGAGFHRDPQFPWAAETLAGEGSGHAMLTGLSDFIGAVLTKEA